jgi:hypothetical protein
MLITWTIIPKLTYSILLSSKEPNIRDWSVTHKIICSVRYYAVLRVTRPERCNSYRKTHLYLVNYTCHVFLMSPLSTANQNQYNSMLISCVVAHFICTHVVMGSSLHKINLYWFMQTPYFVLYHTKNHYAKFVYFSTLYYRISVYEPAVSGASVDPTSQVRSSSVLVLPTVGK